MESLERKKQNKVVSILLTQNGLALRRYYVESILNIITFLSSNGPTFRDNWDMDTNRENGFFQSMFEYTMKNCKSLYQLFRKMRSTRHP